MYRESFGEKIREARKQRGLTQSEVAKELKTKQSTIANYETGRTEPDIETLGKLIDLYECQANWIIGTKK